MIDISLFFYILSILFFANGIVLVFRGNVTVGLYIVFGLSICCFIWAKFHNQIICLTSHGILLVLRYIIIAGIIIYIAFILFILSFGHTNVNYNEDLIIVLGAGVNNGKVSKVLQNRLDASIIYCESNPNAKIVVSGGPTRQKDTTEAAAMAEYLISKGIPAEKIILEDESQSTMENYKFTKKILDEKNIPYKSIAFVTNDFHIYRAKKYAAYCGFENANALSTKTDLFSFVPAVTREVLGIIDMWFFKLK